MTTTERSSTGLDANIAAALSYLFGLISGIVFFAIESESRFVKFHALQSMMVSVAVMAVYIGYSIVLLILGRLPFLGWLLALVGWLGFLLLMLAFVALWIFCMVKAFNGERFKLPYLGELAEQQVWPSTRK
jgi:uncharacterized membrane protein